MLHFEPYSLETLKKMLPFIRKSPYLCNDLSAGSLFMWQEGTDVRFCVWNETFVLRQDIGDQPAFSWPFGKDPEGMIDELIRYVDENDLPLRFFAVSDDLLEEIRRDRRFDTVSADHETKWSDYIYSFEEASTFRGKKFSGQRNHINKFRKLYGEPAVRFLTPEDRASVDRMLHRYEAEHADANALEKYELERTRELLDIYAELGLYAACLTVNGEIAAFNIGEIIGDMLIIHVEKALTRFEGVYPTMYQGFVRLMEAHIGSSLKLINREDDSGDPGLRTSKRQYQPIRMIHKNLVHVNSPAAMIDSLPVLKAGDVVLTAIYERDKDAYLRLNTDIENNRLWGYDYREDLSITGPVDENTFYNSLQYDMRAGDSVNFAIRLSEEGEMIGETILWHFTSGKNVEIGCRLFPFYHGKGYGKAAFGATAAYASKTLGLIPRAKCFLENQASYRMIVGNGFVRVRQDETYFYFEKQDTPGTSLPHAFTKNER